VTLEQLELLDVLLGRFAVELLLAFEDADALVADLLGPLQCRRLLLLLPQVKEEGPLEMGEALRESLRPEERRQLP